MEPCSSGLFLRWLWILCSFIRLKSWGAKSPKIAEVAAPPEIAMSEDTIIRDKNDFKLSAEVDDDREMFLAGLLVLACMIFMMVMACLGLNEQDHARAHVGLMVGSVLFLLVAFLAPSSTLTQLKQLPATLKSGRFEYRTAKVVVALTLYLLSVVSLIFIVDFGEIVSKGFTVGAVVSVTSVRILRAYPKTW